MPLPSLISGDFSTLILRSQELLAMLTPEIEVSEADEALTDPDKVIKKTIPTDELANVNQAITQTFNTETINLVMGESGQQTVHTLHTPLQNAEANAGAAEEITGQRQSFLAGKITRLYGFLDGVAASVAAWILTSENVPVAATLLLTNIIGILQRLANFFV